MPSWSIGVGDRLPQQVGVGVVLFRQQAVLEVEVHHRRADLRHRPGVERLAVLFLEGRRVGVGHVVDEIELARAQRRQAHAILLLRPADQRVEIGQRIAFGVGLPEVLEAHHLGHVEAAPRLELERPAIDRMGVGRVDRARRHQVHRVVDQVDVERCVRLLEVELHRVLVVDRDALDVGQHRAREGVADLGILDALDVPLDRLGVDRLAVVVLGAAPELEGPGLEISRWLPRLGDGRLGLHLVVEIDQPAGDGGERRGDEVDDVAVRIEPDRVLARAEAQRAAALGMALVRRGRLGQADERGTRERRRRLQKTTPCTNAALLDCFAFHGRRLPELFVLGRVRLGVLNAYSIGLSLRIRRPAHGSAMRKSLPSFGVKVNTCANSDGASCDARRLVRMHGM
jgi:hypothetical protein